MIEIERGGQKKKEKKKIQKSNVHKRTKGKKKSQWKKKPHTEADKNLLVVL